MIDGEDEGRTQTDGQNIADDANAGADGQATPESTTVPSDGEPSGDGGEAAAIEEAQPDSEEDGGEAA